MSQVDPPDPAPPPIPAPPPGPAHSPVFDQDRQRAVDRIQQALAEDRLEFEELDERLAAVYAAENAAALERVVADLPAVDTPPPPPTARHPAPTSRVALVGDLKIGGWLNLEHDLTLFSGIGDTRLDLSGAHVGPQGVTIDVWSLVGDAVVIVPDGARVSLGGTTVLGDTREAIGPPVADGPVFRIRAYGLIGDVKVYSLSLVPEGRLRRWWASLRGRG